jgi:uncharacterized protein YPO0396
MTQEQVQHIKQQVAFAKTLTDEKQRHEAFELISQQRDEIMLDCFRKQSERIKNVVKQNELFEADINEIKMTLKEIKEDLGPLKNMKSTYDRKRYEKDGMIKFLSALKIVGITGGSAGLGAGLLKLIQIFL